LRKVISKRIKSRYDRRSVGQSILGVETHLGLTTGYQWYSFLFDIYCFVDVGRPLWREIGPVICISHLNCFSSIILLLALASYFISDCLWSAFFTSKRHTPSRHVKVAVHGEGVKEYSCVLGLYNKTMINLFSFATAYVSEKFTLVRCSFTRKTAVVIVLYYLVFCNKTVEHRVTEKYLATVGEDIVG
jgi:hypothetical protein